MAQKSTPEKIEGRWEKGVWISTTTDGAPETTNYSSSVWSTPIARIATTIFADTSREVQRKDIVSSPVVSSPSPITVTSKLDTGSPTAAWTNVVCKSEYGNSQWRTKHAEALEEMRLGTGGRIGFGDGDAIGKQELSHRTPSKQILYNPTHESLALR